MKRLRLIFMGSPEIAVPCLDALYHAGHEILEVWSQPDKPQGRGKKMMAAPVKVRALDLGLKTYQPHRVKDPEVLDHLAGLRPDLVIVIAYGKILPQDILDNPPYGFLNIHFSLLPEYRGSACVAYPVLEGKKITGLSSMRIQAGPVDSGAVYFQEEMAITEQDTTDSLEYKMSLRAPELLNKTIRQLMENPNWQGTPQDETKASTVALLKKEDGLIDWNKSAAQIDCLVRAMFSWPGAYSFLGEKKLTLIKVKAHQEQKGIEVGELLYIKKEGLFVNCGTGSIEVLELIPAGKKIMSGEAFARGANLHTGVCLK